MTNNLEALAQGVNLNLYQKALAAKELKDLLKNRDEMLSNMQYYMEYCEANGYVTPQEWLEKHKHF